MTRLTPLGRLCAVIAGPAIYSVAYVTHWLVGLA